MKFSGNGLYIEEYIKCQNCGYLIYETELDKTIEDNKENIFCSKWCLDRFNSDEKDSENENDSLLSNDHQEQKEEDDLEIPAFLRRQKN